MKIKILQKTFKKFKIFLKSFSGDLKAPKEPMLYENPLHIFSLYSIMQVYIPIIIEEREQYVYVDCKRLERL
jgi:hypothetical protein